MQRSQWVAILTGILAISLGIGYLILVQILDWRGEMLPAPTEISTILAMSDLWSGLADFL